MKTWQQFINEHEGRFSGVDLGGGGILHQIKVARRKTAETLNGLIEEGELKPDMKLADVIEYLLQS